MVFFAAHLRAKGQEFRACAGRYDMLVAAHAISQRIALICASEMLPSRSCSVAIASGEETKTEKRRHATSGSSGRRAPGAFRCTGMHPTRRASDERPSHPSLMPYGAPQKTDSRAFAELSTKARRATAPAALAAALAAFESCTLQPGRPAWWRTSSSRYRAAPHGPHSTRRGIPPPDAEPPQWKNVRAASSAAVSGRHGVSASERHTTRWPKRSRPTLQSLGTGSSWMPL